MLRSIATRSALNELAPPRPPQSSLVRSELVVNAENRSVLSELVSEIDSADEIDLLCAFIKWSGFLRFREALQRHCQTRGRKLRVLTTTYMGATDERAVTELTKLGAEVHVSYDVETTRLHAKAWLFRRRSGFDTAYIGSSNLSKAALTDGIEWNVRVTSADNSQILERFRAVFDSYWDSPEAGFVEYREEHQVAFRAALKRARGHGEDGGVRLNIEVVARGYQLEMLEQLEAARAAGEHRNLVVAATGTGKTVVAAFDFKKQHREGVVKSLLFVAHREEILRQSKALFEHIAGISGELYVGGARPTEGKFVFASIQSLRGLLDRGAIPADHFEMVIVDEVHHGAAPTYQKLFETLRPKLLLGLTATPERSDGLPLLEYFGGKFAAELRLWSAIEQQILVPFTYFALDDGTDLSQVQWVRGRYDREAMSENLVTSMHVWVQQLVRSLANYVSDVGAMRALAFCVDVRHAKLVAEQLNKHGILAEALTSETEDEVRRSVVARLTSTAADRPRVLCVVDLFNEGVDIPEIDTVLFLRPTESATVFLQQLGRGLRRAPNKDSLLVLDFIGKQYEKFRFDLRYRALTGLTRGELERSLKTGFGRLPAGCTIQLDEVAQENVLRCVRKALPSTSAKQVEELRELGPMTTLARYLESTGLSLGDVYGKHWSWTKLRRAAGFPSVEVGAGEEASLGNLQRLVHADDVRRLGLWAKLADEPQTLLSTEADRRLAAMLFALVYELKTASRLEEALGRFGKDRTLRAEVGELVALLRTETRLVPRDLPLHPDIPLVGHARYLTDELAAAFGLRSKEGVLYRSQSGVVAAPGGHELLMTTLDKEQKKNTPHLQYEDYALSPNEFHWQSQARTLVDSTQGRRHVQHRAEGVTPVLLVRERENDERGLAMGFRYLGPLQHVRHEGERPISVVWKLAAPMPAQLFLAAQVAA